MALSGLGLGAALVIALSAGAAIAWAVVGSRLRQRRAIEAERLRARDERITELESVRRAQSVELETLRDRLQGEGERRSAAEAKAQGTERLESVLEERERELAALRTTVADQQARIAHLQTRLEDQQAATREQLGLLAEARENLTQSFQALSAKALAESNRSFLDLARETLERYQSEARSDLKGRQKAVEHLVGPIRESLGRVDEQLRHLETARQEAYVGLREQIQGLSRSQSGLQNETRKLADALRAPNVRGQWGEIQLRRVVELAGMLPHTDFVEQERVSGEEGSQLRPDLIVRLPGSKTVVVDAKAPLKDLLAAIDADDETKRKEHLKAHSLQLRRHMEKLGAKGYAERLDSAPEFVVLFLPSESFFSAALEQAPTLIEEGVRNGVILATPTTLIALLRAVSYGWRQEKLAEGAQAISQLGRELYDRLRRMSGHLDRLGTQLRRAVESYNQSIGSYQSRVLVSARRFEELGVPSGGEIAGLEAIDLQPRSLGSGSGSPALGDGEPAEDATEEADTSALSSETEPQTLPT